MNQHECKAPGCAIKVGTDKLMCSAHWSRVPGVRPGTQGRIPDRIWALKEFPA